MATIEKRVTFINSDPSTAIAESVTHMPNPLDPNAPPIKIKKKPGRKPNPASPALRKAQNRAAQRAFRERKERHLKELEETIKNLKDNQGVVTSKLDTQIQERQTVVDSLRRENEYFKSMVVSLQNLLTQHGIPLPASTFVDVVPTQTKVQDKADEPQSQCELDKDAHDSSIDSSSLSSPSSSSYDSLSSPVSSATSFDDIMMMPIDVPTDSTSGQSFLDSVNNDFTLISDQPSSPSNSSSFLESNNFSDFLTTDGSSPSADSFTKSFFGDEFSDAISLIEPILPPTPPLAFKEVSLITSSSGIPNVGPITINAGGLVLGPFNSSDIPPNNVAALQFISLQLMLEETTKKALVPVTIKPTFLQTTVPHDPRIDLIPCPGLRDRMIIFRDQYNLDTVCELLAKKSTFHGGDPTDPSSWELPEEFFEQFWFLCVDVNAERTNRWRKARGAPTVRLRGSNMIAENKEGVPMST